MPLFLTEIHVADVLQQQLPDVLLATTGTFGLDLNVSPLGGASSAASRVRGNSGLIPGVSLPHSIWFVFVVLLFASFRLFFALLTLLGSLPESL